MKKGGVSGWGGVVGEKKNSWVSKNINTDYLTTSNFASADCPSLMAIGPKDSWYETGMASLTC